MIEVYINDQKVDIQLENEKTVGEILSSFEKTCEENNNAVINIYINDLQITAQNFDEEYTKPLQEDMKFYFYTVNPAAIKQSFSELSVYFAKLSDEMEQIPVKLQSGKISEASESIKNLADSIDNFCHVAALASLFPSDFKEIQIDGQNFKEFLQGLSPILADFENGLENKDSVLIGDLSEYELCPRLKSISEALKNL